MEDGRITLKINAFEYVIDRLVDWFKRKNPDKSFEDNFDKLKVFKLLFFVATAKASKEKDGSLLDIFDKFIAMPYGPVEVDVYNNLDRMTKYKLEPNRITQTDKSPIKLSETLNEDLFIESIDLLEQNNPDLINYDAFKLVDISHKWLSWRFVYQNSQKHNVLIPKELFSYDRKYYQ